MHVRLLLYEQKKIKPIMRIGTGNENSTSKRTGQPTNKTQLRGHTSNCLVDHCQK